MPRSATRRASVLTALACVVGLAACTGNGGDSAPTPRPAVAPETATAAARTAVTGIVSTLSAADQEGDAARAGVFVGPALETANARARTLPAKTAKERAALQLDAADVTVLAITRASDEPRQILAQTSLEGSGAAVLVLLVADQPGEAAPTTASTGGTTGTPVAPGAPSTGFKVAAVTPVLPSATVEALDPVSTGSEPVSDGTDLVEPPDEVVKAFADSVAYPDPTPSDLLEDDPLSTQLREDAAEQAKTISGRGVFTQTHTPGGVLGGFRLAGDAGVLVFTHLVRDETIALRNPVDLTPGKDFTLLTGVTTITTEAKLTSNEIVAFVIPESGKARAVAASDQLVDGSGR